MRILIIYNQYRQKIQGEQIAIDALVDLLIKRGHVVEVYRENTVSSDASGFDKICVAIASIYNRRAFLAIEKQIKQFSPDIVHFHNIYPRLGMSAIRVCEKYNLSTIISLHNYFLTCPILKHFRNNEICAECITRSEFSCIRNNCRNNLIESIVYASRSILAARMNIHQRFDAYVAQSVFAKDFLHHYGVPGEKLHLLRNFSAAGKVPSSIDRNSDDSAVPYALFLGRISAEKGVEDIIALAKKKPGLNIKIAGGSLNISVWQWPENISYLGELKPLEAHQLLAQASCLLFTSRWFEMCPLVILEAMTLKIPIIATNIGGIPELVKPGERGLIYTPGDIESLAKHVERLSEDAKARQRYIENAYHYVCTTLSEDAHYAGLMNIYQAALEQKTGTFHNEIK
jgi:glycosyltransferase involved in cell wall biosynthesis